MNQPSVPPWKTLLARKTAEHYRRFHSGTVNLTRRGFLSTTAGVTGLLAASQFAFSTRAPADQDAKTTAEPNPIPGGGTAFGFHVHHNPLPNNPTLPLTIFNSAQGDPSEIGDFNGLVVATMIRGLGTGDGVTFADDTKPGSLAFRADMGAMQGVYVGEDHKHHHGSFVFIWLDIYKGQFDPNNFNPADPTLFSPASQIHDYSPGIAPNGLFWVIPTSQDAIRADLDEGFGSLRVQDASVMDAHDLLNNLTGGEGFSGNGLNIPPIAAVPATVSFDIEWSGVIESQKVVNENQSFRGQFVKTGATINWSAQASQPGGFSFVSEAPNPMRNRYSIIAHEQNGVFFHL
jgi:hypothetical protein